MNEKRWATARILNIFFAIILISMSVLIMYYSGSYEISGQISAYSEPPISTGNRQIERCRNGVIEGNEECDDRNSLNNDGCTAYCKLNVCGDGFRFEGVEECDDGNLFPNDFCSPECKFYEGYENNADGFVSKCLSVSDDNPDFDGDGLSDSCDDDDDNDGMLDASDKCPNSRVGIPVKSNGCSIVDESSEKLLDDSSDSDRDLIPDSLDNCPQLPNPGQLDSDNNGVGDVCEVEEKSGKIIEIEKSKPVKKITPTTYTISGANGGKFQRDEFAQIAVKKEDVVEFVGEDGKKFVIKILKISINSMSFSITEANVKGDLSIGNIKEYELSAQESLAVRLDDVGNSESAYITFMIVGSEEAKITKLAPTFESNVRKEVNRADVEITSSNQDKIAFLLTATALLLMVVVGVYIYWKRYRYRQEEDL